MIHVLPQMKYSINTEKTPEEIYAVLSGVTDKWKFPPGQVMVRLGFSIPARRAKEKLEQLIG